MDLRLSVHKIYKDADYNPAAFNFSEEEARKKKLWRDPRPMPTQAELEAAWDLIKVDVENEEIKDKRRNEYPQIGDQLDVIWKQLNKMRLDGTDLIQDADDMLGKILEVKSKHPKKPKTGKPQ